MDELDPDLEIFNGEKWRCVVWDLITDDFVLFDVQVVADHAADVRPQRVANARRPRGVSPLAHDEGVQFGGALTDQPRVGQGGKVAGEDGEGLPVDGEDVVVASS